MATGNRPPSGYKKRTAKKQAPRKNPPTRGALTKEAYAIIGIGVCIIVSISLIAAGSTGFFGVIINGFLKGAFGVGAVLVPLCILLLSINTFRGAALPLKPAVLLFLCLITTFHLFGANYEVKESAMEYVKERYIGGGFSNGGLLGACIGDIITAALGLIGARIIAVTVSVAALVLITRRSLVDFAQRTYARAKRRAGIIECGSIEDYELEDDEPEDDEPEDDEPPIRSAGRNKRAHSLRVVPDLKVIGGEEPPRKLTIIGNGRYSGAPLYPSKPAKKKGRSKAITLDSSIYDEPYEAEPEAEREPEPEIEREAELAFKPAEYETEQPAPETPPAKAAPRREASAPKEPEETWRGDDVAPWEDAPPGISITGTGVEGYTAAAVDADGEIVETAFHEGDRPSLEHKEYVYPPVELLKENPYVPSTASRAEILENSLKLEETLKSFGVEAKVVEVCKGPTVTRYEMAPGVGVKVSKISSLSDDLALNLAAETIRIEAPVPGKSVVGIEIPNKETQSVYLRDVVGDEAFWAYPSKLSFAIGKDIAGNTVIADIAKMPHLLIAGATGAGKSVCINTLIASIVYKAAPDEVKLLMIDPKIVELSVYNPIPHLLIPVVTDPKKASGALSWAVREMEMRYGLFAETFVRDLKGYNAARAEIGEPPIPQIVIIIDELADLMMTCGKEVEESICRLAQKARAAGLHLIIATQRPSVDVITGLIKANIPSRLAFAVTSGTDSRTILDMVGAEKLLGKGDMLFSPVGLSKPQRIQGSFISDKEVENLVNFIRRDDAYEIDEEMVAKITTPTDSDDYVPEGGDDIVEDAIAFLVTRDKASVSMLQRKFRIGYNRAANIIEELESRGIVGPEDGSRPRKVLMTQFQFQEYKERRERIEY